MWQQCTVSSSRAFALHCRHPARRGFSSRNCNRGLASGDGPSSPRTSPRHPPSSLESTKKDPPRADDREEVELRKAVAAAVPELLRRKYGAPAPSLELLAALNGYDGPVHPAAGAGGGGIRVPLGEGVVAEGRSGLGGDYAVFARRTRQKQQKGTTKTKRRISRHPPFSTEDSTLYRILETRVEEGFNRREERVRRWYEEKSRRAQSAYANAVQRVHGLVPRSGVPGAKDASGECDKVSVVDDLGCHPPPTSEEEEEPSSAVGGEDLLIRCRDGQILLVEDVPTPHRLLVLPRAPSLPSPDPYRLGHGRSGTVVYAGLVLFGAMPVAYRSARFALDHPVVARVAVASVVGSVSYSLWVSRRAARTRRSLAVAEASASRIVARDDAARLVLMDGAAESMAEAVVEEYLSRLKGGVERSGSGSDSDSDSDSDSNSERNKRLLMFVDPVEIAADLGLLVRCDSGLSGAWAASDLRTARSGLYRRLFSQTDGNFRLSDGTTKVQT